MRIYFVRHGKTEWNLARRLQGQKGDSPLLPESYEAIERVHKFLEPIEFDKVLLVDNNGTVTVGAPTVEGAKVVCEVVSHLVKGDKVLVFHKKRRKGYRKLNGHRQQFTELTIKQVIA